MKKLILILAVSFLFVQVSKAELFQWGIKAGLGYSSLTIADVTNLGSGSDVYDLATGDGVAAYHIGLQTRIKFAVFFIQPELYFNDGGGSINAIDANGVSEVTNLDMKSVDLPIILGVKFGPLRINAGPVGTYMLSEGTIELEIETVIKDYTVFTSGLTWGFQAGLGVDLSKFSLDARYQGSLSALGESVTIGGQEFNLDARPSQIIFSVGFWF
jgi:hypothetical protein